MIVLRNAQAGGSYYFHTRSHYLLIQSFWPSLACSVLVLNLFSAFLRVGVGKDSCTVFAFLFDC